MAAIAIALVAATGVALAAASHPRVMTAQNAALGKTILVDSHGRTLYHFTLESPRHIACKGACLRVWPPLIVPSRAAATGIGPNGGKLRGLGTVRRPDGRLEVTYRGMLLHRYSGDHHPGDVNGQQIPHWFATVLHGAAGMGQAPPPPPQNNPPPMYPPAGGQPAGGGSPGYPPY